MEFSSCEKRKTLELVGEEVQRLNSLRSFLALIFLELHRGSSVPSPPSSNQLSGPMSLRDFFGRKKGELKLKLHILATSCKELTHWKDSDAGRDWGQEEKGMTEDEMAGWHH